MALACTEGGDAKLGWQQNPAPYAAMGRVRGGTIRQSQGDSRVPFLSHQKGSHKHKSHRENQLSLAHQSTCSTKSDRTRFQAEMRV